MSDTSDTIKTYNDAMFTSGFICAIVFVFCVEGNSGEYMELEVVPYAQELCAPSEVRSIEVDTALFTEGVSNNDYDIVCTNNAHFYDISKQDWEKTNDE